MIDQGTALIKFSESEIECLVNSLYMTTSLKVPTENNGDWKTPYRMLLKEVEDIKYKLKDKKRDIINDTSKESYQAKEKCEECND